MVRFRRLFLCFIILAAFSSACSVTFAGRPPTPVPTIHLPTPIVPTLTPTPESTPIPTYPPKMEMKSDRLEVIVLETSETLFFDKELGYLMLFPPEWLVVPVDESTHGEYLGLVRAEISDDAALWVNEFFFNEAAEVMRLVAMDYTMNFSEGENIIANINVSYVQEGWPAGAGLNDILLYQAAVMPTEIPNALVSEQSIKTNSNGIEYARMIVSHPANTFGVPVKQVMLMTKLEDGVLIFTGTAKDNLFPTVEPVFQQIFDSLEFVE